MSGKLLLFILIIVCYSQSLATATLCWSCSSDKTSEKFCDDPFDSKNDEYKEECGGTYLAGKTMVCRKLIQEYNGLKITRRDCFEQSFNAATNSCLYENGNRYFNTFFCETCETDGCNGAMQQHGAMTSIVVALILLVSVSLS